MSDRSRNTITYILQSSFFGAIPHDRLRDLVPHITVKKARHGQFFPLSQEGKSRLFIVFQGALKVTEVGPAGEELFKMIAFKDDLFGGLLTTSPNEYGYVISKEAIILCIPYNEFNHWVQGHPDLVKHYHHKLQVSIQSMQEWYTNMMRLDVKSRLIYFLTTLGKKEGTMLDNHTLIEKRFTQDELAHLLFTSRQSIVRVLRELSDEGRISFDRRHIELTDSLVA